jgi:hypothetical protein
MGNPPVSRALVRRARLNYKFQLILLAKLLLAHAYLAEFCFLVVLIFESTTKLNAVNYSAILSSVEIYSSDLGYVYMEIDQRQSSES